MIGLTTAAFGAGPEVEVHAGPTAFFHQSPTRLGLGVGGQVGVRGRWARGSLGVAASVGRLQLTDSRWVVELGTDLRGDQRTYRPWVGLEAVALVGAYRIRTTIHPDPWRGPAVAVGGAVHPAVFVWGRTWWSLAECSVGLPLEGRGVAAAVTPVSGGLTF